jgi:intracellular septation protein A
MKVGLFYTLVVMIIVTFLQYRGISLLAISTITDISIHLNSLLMQFSSNPPTLPLDSMMYVVKYFYVLILGIFSIAIIIPTFRFTQTLIKMSLGKRSERPNKFWITFIWVEFFYPVTMLVVFSPLFIDYMNCVGDGQSCPADSWRSDTTLVFIQTFVILSYGFIKVMGLKKHIQSFMDFSVETVSHIIISKDPAVRQVLHGVIEVQNHRILHPAC